MSLSLEGSELGRLLQARVTRGVRACGSESLASNEAGEDELVAGLSASELEQPGLAGWLTQRFVRAVHAEHQFAELDEAVVARVRRAYEHSVAALLELRQRSLAPPASVGAARAIAAAELAELQSALAGLRLGPAVVCAEYEPELQLRVLQLELDQLNPPILDVGAGEHGRLVAYLREHGLEAFGVERHASAAHVISSDWLSYRPQPGEFGTIVSHQAFSLHFLHFHLAPGDTAYRYARQYMALLEGLRPGGAFVYAPGLPFIEQHLQGFRVKRAALPEPLRGALQNAFLSKVGADVAYAAHVTRAG